ncbi:MAG: serine/threonine protein kinase [Gemmatimonadota bacterium]|nr:MAG: serine/threonine protein kinase [Gemmatimonadota bacterium]
MPDDIESIKGALAGRYAIKRRLGSGGMATVYLARDLKHGRDVAVKVLRPELTAAVGSDRFLREIRITAQLNHPHILPLLDSGEADGFLYYVMPYVAGGSLRGHLSRGARVPFDVTLRIAQQVAAALEHAHRHGVIHRDIKPENILFSEGLAVVADFGIAKAVSAAGRESLTRTGVPLGTPGYMSPEQAAAIAEFDERTDVYGLACVVYEMLVGDTPGLWPTEEALRLGRFVDASPEHRECLDGLPGRLEQALVRALAVRPANRFATPVEFADVLAAAAEGSVKLSDGQVRRILERAAELEAEHPTEEGALSIGAVEQVAAEVGIAPERVREAARELARPRVSGAAWQAGAEPRSPGPSRDTLTIDRTVEGEIPESEYEALVAEIQAALGIVGHVSAVGGTLTWSPAAPRPEGRKVIVTVTRQAGQTRIHVEERLELTDWRQLACSAGGIGGAALGAALGLFFSADPGPLILIPIALGAFWGVFASRHTLTRGLREQREPQLERLVDRLAALAAEVPGAALERGAGRRRPALPEAGGSS